MRNTSIAMLVVLVGCSDGGPSTGHAKGMASTLEYCSDPAKPMRCEEDQSMCFSQTFDCLHPAWSCGGAMWACDAYDTAPGDHHHGSCCAGELFVCENDTKYYCPESGACIDVPQDPVTGFPDYEGTCPSISQCTLRAVQCNTAFNT